LLLGVYLLINLLNLHLTERRQPLTPHGPHIPENFRYLTLNGRRKFIKGNESTLIPPTPTLGSHPESSSFFCATSCLEDEMCTRFVYNKTSVECQRYKPLSAYQMNSPIGTIDELVLFYDEAEVNYVNFVSHTNLTFSYLFIMFCYICNIIFKLLDL
jgi:hypothetical protein